MKYLLISLVLLFSKPVLASTNRCFAPGTTIVFGNGVLTNYTQAEANLEKLKGLRNWEKDIEPETHNLKFGLAYNQTRGIADDFMDCIRQKSIEYTSLIRMYFGKSSGKQSDDEKYQEFLKKLMAKHAHKVEDQPEHYEYYKSLIRAGRRISLVSHSQGNFYANASFHKMDQILSGKAKSFFSNVQVATPAHEVASGGAYFTNSIDFISRIVPKALPANHELDSNFAKMVNDKLFSSIAAHDFSGVYLSEPSLSKKIADAVVSQTKALNHPGNEEIAVVGSSTNTKTLRGTIRLKGSRNLNLSGVDCSKHKPLGQIGNLFPGGVWTCVWTDNGAANGKQKLSMTFMDPEAPKLNKWISGNDVLITFSDTDCGEAMANSTYPAETDVRVLNWDEKKNEIKMTFKTKLSKGDMFDGSLEIVDIEDGFAENRF